MPTIYKLTQAEGKLAGIIWESGPIMSGELVKKAEEQFKWKRTTTYTILKKLCEKGIFQNNDATVSALVTKDEFYKGQSRRYVEDMFGGSLPMFLASYIGGKSLTAKQADELKRLIAEHSESDACD